MDTNLIIIFSIAGAAVIGGTVYLAVGGIKRASREADRLGDLLDARAKDLAPMVADTMRSIGSFFESFHGDVGTAVAEDGTVTLMFSDIVDSTPLNVKLGDEKWVGVLKVHDRVVRNAVKAHGGKVVKSQGDGFMLAFKEAPRAVACALAMQRDLNEADTQVLLRLRIGIHTGEAIKRGGDFFGANVAFASRVAQQAPPGGILVSASVRERAAELEDVRFDRGHRVILKGIPGRHRLYGVRSSMGFLAA